MKAKGKKKRKTDLSGTLSLEAVIVFPLVLMLILVFIGAIHGEQDAMILSHALDQTAHEVALLLPLADLLERYVDPSALIESVIPDATLAGIARDGLADVAATVLGSPFLLQRLDKWAKATAHSQKRRAPDGARRLVVDYDGERQTIWLCLSFEQSTLFTSQWTEVRSRVPVWNAHSFRQDGDRDEGDKDAIWMLPNFERGQAFRKLFGGHLPRFYPVIASWNGHEAVSIKSIDLTAPSWSTPAAAGQRIGRLVSELASFEGAGGEGPGTGEIKARRLILVIPENEIPWKTGERLSQWVAEARSSGVVLDIREYGKSHAYEPAG